MSTDAPYNISLAAREPGRRERAEPVCCTTYGLIHDVELIIDITKAYLVGKPVRRED